MNACVFAGPSLPPEDRSEDARIRFLPPVAQGDLLPLIEDGVRVIGIVDGYFEAVPSVLHKEILYALSRGIAVVGGASMGALRAAELAPFGMVGAGAIFEDYRSGRIDADDEVAVLHGPAETGYLALSDAMVDIRATMAKARADGVIEDRQHEALLMLARQRHYRERRYQRMLDDAAASGLAASVVERLSAWLPTGKVQQKRLDALMVVSKVKDLLSEPEASTMEWELEWTDAFDTVVRDAARQYAPSDPLTPAVLDELRLRPAEFARIRDRALLRGLARGLPVAGAADHAVAGLDRLTELYSAHGLYSRALQLEWLGAQRVDDDALAEMLGESEPLERLREAPPGWIWQEMVNELRLTGMYAELAGRAEDKQAMIGGGDEEVDLMARSMLRSTLVDTFLRESCPDHILDHDRFLLLCGFSGREDLGRILLRDHLYRRQQGASK